MKRYSRPILGGILVLCLGLLFFVRNVGANQSGTEAFVLSGTLETRQTRLASEVSARVLSVRVNKGDKVKSGDILVELDDSSIKSMLAEAESGARAAQANLDQVREVARPGNLALAQSGVMQSQADLSAAQMALADAKRTLASPQDLTAQLHAWEAKVAAAEGSIVAAEVTIAGITNQIAITQNDQSMAGKYQLAAQQKQLAAAQATLSAAKADQAGSQHVVDLYKALVTNPLDLVAAQHAAEFGVQAAQAGVQAANADLDIVRRPPQPEAVALAEAKLKAAQANLNLVQLQAKRYVITSPIDGTVIDRTIDPGETSRPGSALLMVANTSALQMTLYVPIRTMSSIRIGQPMNIRLPSLPGKTYSGKIDYIAPEAEFKPANLYNSQDRSEIVFSVRVSIPNEGQELKAGLPADASPK